MRRSIGWLVAAAIALGPRAARAQPSDGLAWSADQCGSLDALRARIEVHLGRPLAATDAIHADVEVVRTPIEGDVHATVTIATRRGRTARDVHGTDCTQVVDAVAFVLASAVSDERDLPPRPDPLDAIEDPGPLVRAAPPPPERFAWPVEQDRVEVVLDFDLWSDEGTLPVRQLGLGGSLALSKGAYRGEVGVAIWSGDWTSLQGPSGVTLRSIAFRGCRGMRRLWLCGGLLEGTIRSAPRPGGSPEQAWTAISFQTLWSVGIVGPVHVGASIEGVANVVRPGFFTRDDRIEERPEWFALRLGLGVGVVLR